MSVDLLPSTVAARYGGAAPDDIATSDVIELQLAHRSVRRYLPDEVTPAELAAVVAAAQSAATSSNLQLWSVVAVRDVERRAALSALSGDQAHITQAPLLLVWLVDLGRAHAIAAAHEAPTEGADFLESAVVGFVDAALAAQNAVLAAESLGLGTVYIGALRNRPAEVAVRSHGERVVVLDPRQQRSGKATADFESFGRRQRHHPASVRSA